MKTLPYFRWFPSDAETDVSYTSLSLEALGLYHRMLNVAWMNGGLPSTPNAIAAALRIPRRQFLRLWNEVSPRWQLLEDRLYNKRQEEERVHAQMKSEKSTDAVRRRYGRRSDESPRAYESVSVSDSVSQNELVGKLEIGPIRQIRAADLNGHTSQKFPDWWELWSKVRGTYNKTAACQAYISVVSTELETQCFECTSSYLASLESPNRGFNPENFLFTQAKDGFEARWPARALSRAEKLNRLLEEEGQ